MGSDRWWPLLASLGLGSAAAAQGSDQPLADWQQNPLPTLQGDWDFHWPEMGGPSRIRIVDRKIVMLVPLNEKGSGEAFWKVPAGATAMDITRWGPDSTTGTNQVRIWGTCYDYTNSNGRPWDCWHILNKYSPGSRSRTGKATAWGIAGYERYHDETRTANAGAGEARPVPASRTPAVTPEQVADETVTAAAQEAERKRTEALNDEISRKNAALLEENRVRRQQFADAQASHQRQVEAADRARREHEAAVERSRQSAAEYQRNLDSYERALRVGRFTKPETEANIKIAEAQRQAAKAEEDRLATLRREADERNRPIEFKEGIVLCEQPGSGARNWRCHGPLQTTYGELDTQSGKVALAQACGTDQAIRDLGTTGSYRVFGCGFGIHPTAVDYPGNLDIPARLGVSVEGRSTFECPRSTLAYCRGVQ